MPSKTATGPRFACARCGRKQYATEMVRSAYTKEHYCADTFKCQRRAKREARS